jgi:hypothetical protein
MNNLSGDRPRSRAGSLSLRALAAERQRQDNHCCERKDAAQSRETPAPQTLPAATPADSGIELS